ncbi:MAG: DUF998 domain-containing protein [Streptosporangiaceae bacterium]
MAGWAELETGLAGTGAPDDSGAASDGHDKFRRALAWTLGTAGLVAYSWWLLVPLKPGLMRSPDELFSNLEVTGQPYASAMQHADLASGLLLVGAFWVAGYGSRAVRREWLAMLGFGVSGALGGLFPEICADGVNAACRQMEVQFQLPASQYIHMVAGIFEFFFITAALALAVRRTRGQYTRTAVVYRWLAKAAVVAYPLLGLAYLLDRLGGVMEAVFFVGFTVMVLAQLAERTRATRGQLTAERRVSATCGQG